MKCDYCKKQHNRRRFCSTDCKNEWHKLQKRIKNKKRFSKEKPKKKCDHCGNKFVCSNPNNSDRQRYCSNECKIEFHKSALRSETELKRTSITRACMTCYKEFTPNKTLKQIYCCKQCRECFPKRIYSMLAHAYHTTGEKNTSHKILGYSPTQLREHIQSHPNWNPKIEWHLDHIFPIAAFVKEGIKDVALICCLENLQPLPGKENCSKGDSYDSKQFKKWLNKMFSFGSL